MIVTAHPDIDHDAVVDAARRWSSTCAASRAARERRTLVRLCERTAPVRVGVVGLGYWGPNLARNFAALPGAELRWCCDGRRGRPRRAARAASRGARFTDDARRPARPTPTLDAVVLATPVPTHADLAVRVLEAGKHCFVEKPLAPVGRPTPSAPSRPRERPARVLMVGHLLEYHPGVDKLKEIADSGELGDIHYIYSNRLNLGKLRADENALWSLGAHDVSVLLHLAGRGAVRDARRAASATCAPGIEDVVFGFLRFPSGLAAHLHLSWLDPHKERRFTVVGSQADGDVRRHGPRAQGHRLRQGLRRERRLLRRVHHPLGRHLDARGSPTPSRCGSSASTSSTACATGATPRSDGESGLRVVRVLEALQQSLEDGEGRPVLRLAHDAVGPGSLGEGVELRRGRRASAPTSSCTPAP